MAVMNFSETAAAPEVGLKHANLQHPIIFVLLWLFKKVDFYLCSAPPDPLACTPLLLSFLPSPPPVFFPPILIAPCHSCSMPCLTCLRAAVTKIRKRRRILHGFSLGPGTHWCTVWVCMCLSVLTQSAACSSGSVSLTTNRAQTHLNLGALQLHTVHLLNRGLAINLHCWSLDGRQY